MAYLKKAYRILMERIDKELKMPQGWYFFVKKQKEKQNFIIKTKGKCTCRNCNTEFETNKKINEYDKCPKCHNTYLIKQSNYSFHIFEDVLVLLDRLEDKWVIRLFEIFTKYTKNEIYHSKPAEYGRIVIDKDMKNVMEFANDRAVGTMWGELFINHTKTGKKWRWYNKYYRSLDTYGKVYDKNLEELFKNTELKYSQLWKIAKENDEIDIKYHLLNNFPSTELLAKMGLYKLAVCSGDFNKGKSFKERFGVDKSYYEFMKKNNIDRNELNILKMYKKPNIENIKVLSKFYISDLEKVKKYVSIEKFAEYAKNKRNFDIQMYIDYLGFLEKLKMDLKNKKCILMTAHRRENLGQPLENICNAVKRIVEKYEDIEVVYPVHLNPAVQEVAHRVLDGVDRVHLVAPLDVEDMHNIMDRSFLVMTDSGGLQEEAPACGVPVLVLRTETERPEAVQAGTVKVVGVDEEVIFNEAVNLIDNKSEYEKMAHAVNPYGDGHASERIATYIENWFKGE